MDVHPESAVPVDNLAKYVESLQEINRTLREEVYADYVNMVDIRFLHAQDQIIHRLTTLLQRACDLWDKEDTDAAYAAFLDEVDIPFVRLLADIKRRPAPHYAESWEQYTERMAKETQCLVRVTPSARA